MHERHDHQPQHITADEAARLVNSGDWVDYFSAFAQPDVFDAALAARVPELRDVKVRACLTVAPRALLDADPEGEHVTWFSTHFSGYDRKMHDAGICHYLPINLGELGDYYRRFMEPPDVAVIKTCPMDEAGYFNFGPANLWHRAILEMAKTVVVEVNEAMPYVYGVDNGVHASEVDYVVAGDDAPLVELPGAPVTDVDRAVGTLITNEIEDGSCLQIGIGAMPNAVCASLVESGARDLGIHTEMLTDGLVDLYHSGQVTGGRKTLDKGKVVFGFALGSERTYKTLDRNEDFRCCPADYTNLPHIVMQNDRVVSINNTTQVDLQGQAASESDGHRHISGTGGQLQFVRAAYASEGGKSFICLASTYEKHGHRRSRIVLNLTPGNVVTTPRTDIMYVVTEYGCVNLKGKSVADRAKAMISLAHPDFRDDLEREARAHKLVPRMY
jgi:acyl-CoA hydrolase